VQKSAIFICKINAKISLKFITFAPNFIKQSQGKPRF